MGTTLLSKRGVNPDRLSDKMFAFCAEYPIDFNGVRAAIDAGYSKKGAGVRANKLLKNPLVRKTIGNMIRKSMEAKGLTREAILGKVSENLHRDLWLLGDKSGFMVTNLRDIPREIHAAIDGFDVKQFFDEDGNIAKQEIKVKLSPNAAIQDMAMKYIGAYAAEQSEQHVTLDWDKLVTPSGDGGPDAVEQKVLEAEHEAAKEQAQ